MDRNAAPRLERSCAAGDRAGWMRSAPPGPGLERIEAYFAGHGFDPHRHDTYAVGFTMHGVQSFRYRGASTCSVPGQVFVLHPDEVHDGRAGTEDGFRYRILYVEPALIRDALAETRRSLPFARDAVTDDPRLLQAVARTKDLLDSRIETGVGSAELEAATGLSRYALARQFRACLGTSPYRYLVLRRLDRARALIRAGAPLAETAAASGFADQSHLSRQFRRAYGLAPGRWMSMLGAGGGWGS